MAFYNNNDTRKFKISDSIEAEVPRTCPTHKRN